MKETLTMGLIALLVLAVPVPGSLAKKKAAAPADGKASEADCKAACDNVKKLALAELPKELPAEARKAAEAELAKGLAWCPAECQKKSTGAAVKCMAGAKSMEDMMKCGPKPRQLHTFSSVKPYVEHALKGCQCRWVDDAFDQRDCKKRCKGFKKKMLAWAAKNPVIHDSLEIDVGKYSFGSRSFTLQHQDMMIEAEKVPGSVIIGNGRCDGMTDMPMTSQRIVAKMKEKDAKRSILRGMEETEATAVLVGRASSLNWCCDAYTRREAAMDGMSCKGRVFKYTIKELAIPEAPDPSMEEDEGELDKERPWILGFKTPVEGLEFDPQLIGYEEIPGELDD